MGYAWFSLRALVLSGKPVYQNVCEFMSILLGLLGAMLMGWETSAIEIIGDSATVLTWTETGRFRSDNVINAVTCVQPCAPHMSSTLFDSNSCVWMIQLLCLDEVLHLCDPRREFTKEKEFAEFGRICVVLSGACPR